MDRSRKKKEFCNDKEHAMPTIGGQSLEQRLSKPSIGKVKNQFLHS